MILIASVAMQLVTYGRQPKVVDIEQKTKASLPLMSNYLQLE